MGRQPISFYPRHPRGWRLSYRKTMTWLAEFLSTPPSRVATRQIPPYDSSRTVSIHATLAGGDLGRRPGCLIYTIVSIHATLAGGDHAAHQVYVLVVRVSIHATLAGGDCLWATRIRRS